MNETTFQDLLNQFSSDVFVGRSEHLALFKNLVTTARPQFLILAVSGQGGAGKTTLINKLAQISKDMSVAAGIVNQDQGSVIEVLAGFVEQFEGAGYPFKAFTTRYYKFSELKRQIEADPSIPNGMLDLTLRGLTRVGLRTLKGIPVAGDVAEILLSPTEEEKITEEVNGLVRHVMRKFTNKDDQILLLETEQDLTRHFLQDLSAYTKENHFALFFDTYEQTAPFLDEWLRNLISGKFGSFSQHVHFIIAGRYPLGQPWFQYRGAIRHIELSKFTEEEAVEYLKRSGEKDEAKIREIIEISGCLPVLLAFLVSSPGDIPKNVTGTAVERFLQGATSVEREAALIASVPRFFNQDILSVILRPDRVAEAFSWLSQAHFVKSNERGWAYHETVRAMMLQYLRLRSANQCNKAHEDLASYYSKLCAEMSLPEGTELGNNLWRKRDAERQYHVLSINPTRNFKEELICLLRNLSHNLLNNSDLRGEIYRFIQLIVILYEETKDPGLQPYLDIAQRCSSSNPTSEEALDSIVHFLNMFNTSPDYSKHDRSIAQVLVSVLFDKAGHYTEAISYSKKALLLEPENGLTHLICGKQLSRLKNYADALYHFNKAVKFQPNDADSFFWRGSTFYEMREFQASIDDFDQAVNLAPENASYLLMRGSARFLQKDYTSALIDFNQVIELQENGYNYLVRGCTYHQMKNFSSALENFNKAAQLQPLDSSTLRWRGRTYFDLFDYEQALVDFNKAIAIQPDRIENSKNYYWRGQTHYKMGLLGKSVEDFTRAIEYNPQDGFNFQFRSRVYYELDDYPSALLDLYRAAELLPENSNNYHWLGRTYFAMKNYPSAKDCFNHAIDIDPGNGYHYFWRGQVFLANEDYEAALKDLDQAISLIKDDANLYALRGFIKAVMAEKESALDDFSTVWQMPVKYDSPHIVSAFGLYCLGETDKARSFLAVLKEAKIPISKKGLLNLDFVFDKNADGFIMLISEFQL